MAQRSTFCHERMQCELFPCCGVGVQGNGHMLCLLGQPHLCAFLCSCLSSPVNIQTVNIGAPERTNQQLGCTGVTASALGLQDLHNSL